MSFNIGDYVRTEYGVITKIDNIVNFEQENQKPYLNFNNMLVWTENDRNVAGSRGIIIKSSPNIIDLIEVGDYVNGIRVHEIEREEDGTTIKIGNLTQFIIKDKEDLKHTGGIDGNNDRVFPVKSIVTKEQFENMEYKIGE